jgi:hypothetical protein
MKIAVIDISQHPFIDPLRASPVFRQRFTVVGWNVMSIPTYALYKHQKRNPISVTEKGSLKVKKTTYAPFWKSTNILMQKNTRDFNAY